MFAFCCIKGEVENCSGDEAGLKNCRNMEVVVSFGSLEGSCILRIPQNLIEWMCLCSEKEYSGFDP